MLLCQQKQLSELRTQRSTNVFTGLFVSFTTKEYRSSFWNKSKRVIAETQDCAFMQLWLIAHRYLGKKTQSPQELIRMIRRARLFCLSSESVNEIPVQQVACRTWACASRRSR